MTNRQPSTNPRYARRRSTEEDLRIMAERSVRGRAAAAWKAGEPWGGTRVIVCRDGRFSDECPDCAEDRAFAAYDAWQKALAGNAIYLELFGEVES